MDRYKAAFILVFLCLLAGCSSNAAPAPIIEAPLVEEHSYQPFVPEVSPRPPPVETDAGTYPTIEFLSVSPEHQQIYTEIAHQIPARHYVGVLRIMVYGKERFRWDGLFTTNRIILIDESGLVAFGKTLEHELIHNKCYTKANGWDLTHESACFLEGLV